jgi:hypothetical protein
MAKKSSSGAVVSLKAPFKAEALVDEGLDALNLGFAIFDQNLKLVANNKTFSELRGYPVELLQPGTDIIELYRFNAERGDYGPGDVEAQALSRFERVRERKSADWFSHMRTSPSVNGRSKRLSAMMSNFMWRSITCPGHWPIPMKT